jgi:hypothetical protein
MFRTHTNMWVISQKLSGMGHNSSRPGHLECACSVNVAVGRLIYWWWWLSFKMKDNTHTYCKDLA